LTSKKLAFLYLFHQLEAIFLPVKILPEKVDLPPSLRFCSGQTSIKKKRALLNFALRLPPAARGEDPLYFMTCLANPLQLVFVTRLVSHPTHLSTERPPLSQIVAMVIKGISFLIIGNES